MLDHDLFSEILIKPVSDYNADQLHIVTGYASSAMVDRHFAEISSLGRQLKVNLVIGMVPRDGIMLRQHNAFKHLETSRFSGLFSCRYAHNMPPVHSKVYVWCRGDVPIVAYIGSANYTQRAFDGSQQKEIMDKTQTRTALRYFQGIERESVSCTSPLSDTLTVTGLTRNIEAISDIQTLEIVSSNSAKITLPLHSRNIVPLRSGLNWGQRAQREHNQAYIPIPANIIRRNFFPSIGTRFTVYTDDGEIIVCVRAQQNGKGIQSTFNNSILGRYFRGRLGVTQGSLVTYADLLNYGRDNVDFYAIDGENYYMDFSV